MRVPSFLLRTRVPCKAALGNTGDGETYGDEFTVKAYVETRTRVVVDKAGREHSVRALLTIRAPSPLKVGDRVTVDGDEQTVVVVAPVRDGAGRVVMVEVHCG